MWWFTIIDNEDDWEGEVNKQVRYIQSNPCNQNFYLHKERRSLPNEC